jgi:hypothetical protein
MDEPIAMASADLPIQRLVTYYGAEFSGICQSTFNLPKRAGLQQC